MTFPQSYPATPGKAPLPLKGVQEVPEAISLIDALHEFLPLPPLQLLLGLCEDGLPLLFDLSQPNSAPLLFTADSAVALGVHFKSTLFSACLLNEATDLNMHLISDRPRFYGALERQPHFLINFHLQSPEAGILLEEMANLVDARRQGSEPWPVQLLAIDGLADFAAALNANHLALLRWLVEAGPEQGVWILAAQSGPRLSSLAPDLLALFPTRVDGRLAGYQAVILAGDEEIPVAVPHAEPTDAALLASESSDWSPSQSMLRSFPS